ncbi:hypothetical protein ABFX02_01G105600 [Erythranthe guttata]
MATLVIMPQKWPSRLIASSLPKHRLNKLSICASIKNNSKSEVRKEDIVIVGAGIAGLATAVALQRLGIGSLVVEQAESLRTGGTSLTFSKNGWKILDAIGVGTDLRPQFLQIQGIVMKSEDGRELRSFNFKDEDPTQEMRAVERRILLETLANQLPTNAISFSSKLKNIEITDNNETILKLEGDSHISAKIVIACDGIRSPVAKWMGFSEPRYVGYCAIRGLGSYPNGPKITDPSILREEAVKLVKNWPKELLNVIESTPDDTIIRTPLVDRWLWPGLSPPPSKGNVVLVGDAWHPMTPNLGQGACCALEDAVVLAKKVAQSLKFGNLTVEDVFRSYADERWQRIFPLTVRANLAGGLLQMDNSAVCSFRNNILVPKLIRLGPMLEHTNFDFEPLNFDSV